MNTQSPLQKFWWMAGFFVAFFCFTNTLKAGTTTNETFTLSALQQEWTGIKFEAPEKDKLKQFENLITKVEKNHPNKKDPEYMLWYAMSLSSYAQLKGGLSGLKRAKQAKRMLENAISKDPQVGHGLAHAVLGALYARVPGWPVGFGDKEKATWHLKTAYSIDPKSMDINYYYGDYLVDEHEYQAGKAHLEAALASGKGNDLYTTGRKLEIQAALNKIPHG